MSRQSTGRRVTMQEAADELGVTVEAIRKRVQRETIRSDKGDDGRRYVYLDESHTEVPVDVMGIVEAKDAHIASLEEQLRLRAEEIQRRDVIISQLAQANAALAARVPELEPAQAKDTEPESPGEGVASTQPPPGTVEGSEGDIAAGRRRSWWRRWFGG